jgi:uncharacterized SAM-binding protein YcdF (DUF218 family)
MRRLEGPAAAAVVDALLVVLFVVLGRGSHDDGSAVGGTLRIAAPFLMALAAGWLLGRRRWATPLRIPFGIHLWGVTVVVGMALRHWAFDRGTAPSFIVVAAIVLGAFLLGWRAVAARLLARGRVPTG